MAARRAARSLHAMSSVEARKWGRFLLAQYGKDTEGLAEIGVIETLAIGDARSLVAWSLIFAAIQEIRQAENGM